MKRIVLATLVLLAGTGTSAHAKPPVQVPAGEEPLVDVAPLHPKLLLDIKYATTDNFFGKAAYPVAACVLRKRIAERMVAAQKWLDEKHAGLRLMFKDCYRPDRVQWIMWEAVKDTPKRGYVADPTKGKGSIHAYGAAVDVTLADAEGHELDMGSAYDHLGKLSEPRHEARFLSEKKLTRAQVENRHILRDAMVHAGMKPIPNEWWHFNGPTRGYRRLDVPLEAIVRAKP